MRLIDADALHVEEWMESMGNGMYKVVEVAYKSDIENAPTIEAEPERKKGKWLTEYLDGIPGRRAKITYCSECCRVSPYRHKFCPECGVDMRENEDG